MGNINVMHIVNLRNNYGVERQLVNHLKVSLKNKDTIQHFVCSSTSKIDPCIKKELEQMDIPLISNRLLWPGDIIRFTKFARNNKIDILHAHDKLNRPIKNRIISKLAGIPFVLEHEHGLAWNVKSSLMIRMTNRFSDLHLANSNAAKILLKEMWGIDAKIIYNGVRADTLVSQEDKTVLQAELGIAENDPIVGFVGRLNTSKGLPAFLRMAVSVKATCPSVRFVIVGDGPEMAELKKYSMQLGLDSVRFLGYRDDVREIMGLFNVMVLPAIHEAFGNVIVEAAYNRVPVVASNVDGIAEVIVDGETGFLVDCTEPVNKSFSCKSNKLPRSVVDGKTKKLRSPMLPDTRQLADRVITCLTNPELSKKMGEKAYWRAKQLFSLEMYNDNLNNIYKEIMRVDTK